MISGRGRGLAPSPAIVSAVEISVEQRVETVDDATVADRETQFDHLLRVEVSAQFGEEIIGNRRHAGTRLRKAHDGCLRWAVHAFRKRVIA